MRAPGPLRLEDTVEVSVIGHRLALGVQWLDALTRNPVEGLWVSSLERIGQRQLSQRFELHQHARHALRAAGRLARLLKLAADEKAADPPALPEDDVTGFTLRAFGLRDLRTVNYTVDDDPRRYVPRRLSFIPVQVSGVPSETPANMRQAWLWPGACYPVPPNATTVRGRVRKGANLSSGMSVPWVRVIVTRPGPTPANFNNEVQVGWAHGDDRGEFSVVFGTEAVPGGNVLPQSIALRLWIHLPPTAVLNAKDPLATLPLEQAGTPFVSNILRGTAVPQGFARQAPINVAIKPGQKLVLSDADLLFP